MTSPLLRIAYITAPDREQAARLGRQLIEAKLAACVNIIDGMLSIYPWNGRLEEAREAILLAKTTADRMPALIEAVQRLHTYEVPCVLGLTVAEGAPGYIDWLLQGLQPAER